MVPAKRCWCRQGRQEKLCRGRRIVGPRSSPSAGTVRAAGTGSNTRADTSAATRTCPRSARCARTRRSRSDCGRRGHWLSGNRFLGNSDRRARRFNGNGWRSHNSRGIRNGRPESNILHPLPRAQIRSTIASASSTGRARPAGTNRRIALESAPRRRNKDQKNYERMRKKRGGDFLPPPLSLARYPDRRPVAFVYCDGGSFGDTPMTFTPAPRETSIA